MNSIIFGKIGSPSTLASATAKSNWAFIRIAFPSADGISIIYLLNNYFKLANVVHNVNYANLAGIGKIRIEK